MVNLLNGVYRQYQHILTRLEHASGLPALLIRLYLAPVMLQAGWNKYQGFSNTVEWFGNTEWGTGITCSRGTGRPSDCNRVGRWCFVTRRTIHPAHHNAVDGHHAGCHFCSALAQRLACYCGRIQLVGRRHSLAPASSCRSAGKTCRSKSNFAGTWQL